MRKIVKLAVLLPVLAASIPASGVRAGAADPVAQADEGSGTATRQSAKRESPLLDFDYSWPDSISGDARLVAHLKGDLATSYDEALATARSTKVEMEKSGGPFNQNFFDRQWALQGQAGRLVSLVQTTDSFTGGAHPNRNSAALIWDRQTEGPITLDHLFETSDSLEAATRADYCAKLDSERQKRREGIKLDGDFSKCPDYSALTIAPSDTDGDGAFDSIRFLADPYVAGPYVEGSYDISVAITARLVASVKRDFRSAFEDQRRQ